MTEVNFYIVRHGETLLNKLRKTQGWVDSPLTESGIKTAQYLMNALTEIPFSSILSSDMQRAYQTAQIISNGSYVVQVDRRLREWCLGSLEAEPIQDFIEQIVKNTGITCMSEMNLYLPQICSAINKIDTTGTTESFDKIVHRLKKGLEDIGLRTLKNGGGNVLIVTHAFVIKTIIYMLDKEKLRNISKIQNTSVTKVHFDGKIYTLKFANNTY